jgi:hypothetical protein
MPFTVEAGIAPALLPERWLMLDLLASLMHKLDL